jgi:hypothetical protein
VPAHRNDDHVGWEAEADEGGPWDCSGTRAPGLMSIVSLLPAITGSATAPFQLSYIPLTEVICAAETLS